MEREKEDDRVGRSPPAPNPGFLSRMFFWWMNTLLYKGFSKQVLEQTDLYELQEKNKAEVIQEKFEKYWNDELQECQLLNRKPSMIRPIWRFLRKIIVVSGFHSVIVAVLGIVNALMIGYVVEGLQKKSAGKESDELPYFMLALCIGSYIVAISYHRLQHLGMVMGMRLRVALTCMVYKKVLMLSRVSVTKLTSGHVINLVSNDVRKFDRVFFQIHYIWLGPVTIFAITLWSWRTFDWPAFLGSGYLFLIIPIVLLLGKKLGQIFLKVTRLTDQRVRLTGEAVSGVRAIKMYAWELPLAKMIKLIRRSELRKLFQVNTIFIGLDLAFTTLGPVVNLILFTALSLTGFNFNPKEIFTTMALYDEARFAFAGNFIMEVRLISEALMALKRIRTFLLHPEKGTKALLCNIPSFELPSSSIHQGTRYEELPGKGQIGTFTRLAHTEGEIRISLLELASFNLKEANSNMFHKEIRSFIADERGSLIIDNVTCYWSNDSYKPCLSNINLLVPNGKLLAVCGEVGSGKSSLLSAVLGELLPTRGKITCNGRVTYAPQIPWVFSGTLRQNIIFGQPFDQTHYQDIIEACQLASDIESFPNGDLTYIGERGITLSGGQRARVALARAVYYRADIYLLDDPLSALDIHVGKQLFNKCIKKMLKDFTVVLVTHNLSYLPETDCIVVMRKGSMVAKGSYKELNQLGLRHSFEIGCQASDGGVQVVSRNNRNVQKHEMSETQNLKVEKEKRSVGSVRWETHWKYFRAGNSVAMVTALCVLLVLTQVLMNLSEWWLAQWTNQPYVEQQNRFYIYVFVGIIGSYLLVCFAAEMLMRYSLLRSNRVLQEKMMTSVIKSPVLFFDTNPAGRILNIFSKDIGYMDQEIPSICYYFVVSQLIATGSLVLVATVMVWAAIGAVVVIILFLLLAVAFLRTSRELKRLEAVSRSPLYSHVTDTLDGLTSVQCFQAERRFIKDFFRFQDEQTRAWFGLISGREWLGLRLDFLAVSYLVVACVVAVVTSANAGLSGLALYASFSLAKIVQYTVFFGVDYENLMTSVERVLEYINLPSEPGYQLKTRLSADWPSRGEIEFRSVSLVYYDGGPTILHDVTFKIKAEEKIGIVGQTGAGKSSLLAALFRMPEACRGTILIDGVDISTLNLQNTRAVMSVIPQDPVLFSGDLRNNLDPFSALKDEDLWQALEQVELRDKVESLPGKLRYQLNESGRNLSVGERQLVCLARALLQNNRIIVIDEATANVDHETDHKIQKTIRRSFSGCTVLTIAHRLDTIMDSDKVLVMSEGKAVEYDAPGELLNDDSSMFFKLVKEFKENKH